MVHTSSGFRGTRVGVIQGAGMKNQGDDPLGEPLPRICVSYWCAMGHETRPVFLKLPDDQIPDVGTAATAAARRRAIPVPGCPAKPRKRASRPTSNTLKKDAPARTPKTYWLERWSG